MIQCESEPGRGTTFRIYLPVVGGRMDEPAEARSRVRAPRPGLHVLLVDDDEPVRDVSTRALRKLGYDVTPAPDAPAALSVLEQGAPVDLLVTDLNMPRFKGTHLAREVRSRFPGVRIILMTGLMDEAVEQDARTIGIDGLIAKPFRIDELVATIDQAMAMSV